MPSVPESQRTVRLCLAILCLIWGSTWWAIRLCVAEQPPLSSAALRFLLAGVVMAGVAPLLRRREASPPPPHWLWIVCGITNFAGSYGILYVTEQVVPSGVAAVLWGVFPLLMAASGVLVLGERLRRQQLLGFVVSFAGIVTVSAGDLGGIGRENFGWAMLLLVSPVVAAIGTTLVKKYGAGSSSVVMNRNGMLFGAALLLVAAFASEDPLTMQWTWSSTLATVYLALFGTALAFGIYFHLLRSAPASLLSLITYVTPVLAMLIAAIVGDGEAGVSAWTGTALVVTGIVLVVNRR